MGLEQHVDFSTHVGGHSLDLVITESVNGVTVQLCEPGPFIPDHCAVKTILSITKESVVSKTVISRNYKVIDQLEFAKDLSKVDIDTEQDVDSFVDKLDSELSTILDRHAPTKKKTTTLRAPKPWFSERLLKLKRQSRKLERVWRKYPGKQNYDDFKAARQVYTNELFEEKKNVLSEKMLSAKGNSKKLYNLVSELTGTKSVNPLLEYIADSKLAEDFADFFMDKIDKIRKSLKDFPNFKPTFKDVPLLIISRN